jgi:hypothetical protein
MATSFGRRRIRAGAGDVIVGGLAEDVAAARRDADGPLARSIIGIVDTDTTASRT